MRRVVAPSGPRVVRSAPRRPRATSSTSRARVSRSTGTNAPPSNLTRGASPDDVTEAVEHDLRPPTGALARKLTLLMFHPRHPVVQDIDAVARDPALDPDVLR